MMQHKSGYYTFTIIGACSVLDEDADDILGMLDVDELYMVDKRAQQETKQSYCVLGCV